jgi:hypothetical protein
MHLFIHIGDHKTGTTSIQAFLRRQAGELASAGIAVPTTGTYSEESGHHNLAFQLIGDRRWNQSHGGLDELVAELRCCRQPQAAMSCEDFSLLVAHPEGLKRLESTLQAEGHTLSWLMFLRRVDDYSESLYCELTLHGYQPRFGYPGFVLNFLLHGRYRSKFCDYDAFVREWRRLSVSPLHLFDYDQAVSDGGVLPHFLAAIGAPASLIEDSFAHPVLNRRHERMTRHFRRLFRALLRARFHRSNLRILQA